MTDRSLGDSILTLGILLTVLQSGLHAQQFSSNEFGPNDLLPASAPTTSADNFVDIAAQCGQLACPVDCQEAVTAGGCIACQCPLGGRCPQIVCDGGRGVRCGMLRKMDGCITCVCDGPVFSLLDTFNNVQTFFVDRALPGSVESCRMEDLAQLERCTRGIMEYEDGLRQTNPEIAHPVIPWYHFSSHQLTEMCRAVLLLPACVGKERLARCKDQHPKLSYLLNMYSYPCVENRLEFNDQYTCTANVIASHAMVRTCENTLERELRNSRDNQFSLFVKQERKCAAVNNFVDCSKEVLERHCGKVAAMIFHETVIKGVMYIAPECIINSRGMMQPRPIAVTTAVINDRNVRQLRFGNNGGTILESSQDRDRLINLDAMPDIENEISVTPSVFSDRCVRFPRARSRCRDGSDPLRVLRWFRPTSTSVQCHSYVHNFCVLDEPDDLSVGPIRFEDECMDLCFGVEERHRLFDALQFVDRSRSIDQ